MADEAQFGHDHLGHLLADQLLIVPRFQRAFAWQTTHVEEYWNDIQRARSADRTYFLGTIVLANSTEDDNRKLVIDGQQRITTTALLFIAIRDRLHELNKAQAAGSVESSHLSNYVLVEERSVAKLTLSPTDQPIYGKLLDGESIEKSPSLLYKAFTKLRELVKELAPSEDHYRELIELSNYIDKQVQVLLAVASGLSEAYVIFETLNDRGADLTTGDLLKNYIFSKSDDTAIRFSEISWTKLTNNFDKPDDFVKFLRYEHMSRSGHVTNRGLYKAIQEDIDNREDGVKGYLESASSALAIFRSLKEPDDSSWSSISVEVRDSLLAFRRFGFESNIPLLIAAFKKWKPAQAAKFVNDVAAWSLRAWAADTIGGGVAEKAFCSAAVAVTNGTATTVADVRPYMKGLVPDDSVFKQAFEGLGKMSTTRAKYLLSQLEKQYAKSQNLQVDALPDWSSKTVTVEHIFAKSSRPDNFHSEEEYDRFDLIRDRLQNFTLLERTSNGGLDNSPVSEKLASYRQSAFLLTKRVGESSIWSLDKSADRGEFLSELAIKAWPF